MLFTEEQFKAGQIVKLDFRKHKYLLLENGVLVETKTGKIAKKVNILLPNIVSVFDNQENQLAIKKDGQLYKFNPFIHDPTLNYLKHVNKLLEWNEMEEQLKAEKVFYTDTQNYITVQASKVKISFSEFKNFKTQQKQIIGIKTKQKIQHIKGKETVTGKYQQNITLTILRLTIDEKKGLYLYRLQMSPYFL